MLNLSYTRPFQSNSFKLAEDINHIGEGVALVGEYVNGELVARPALGVAGELFLGISLTTVTHDLVTSTTQDIAIDADTGAILLAKTPIEGSLTGYTPEGEFLPNSAFTADESDPRKFVVDVDASSDSSTIEHIAIVYKYSSDVSDQRALQGDQYPGVLLAPSMHNVGVIQTGLVATSYYDTACDWSNPTALYITEGGLFTTEEGKNTQVRALVVKAPAGDNRYLQLHLL